MQPTQVCQRKHLVRDIMTTPVHSIDMDDSLLHVKQLFERERCHHVVVTNRRRAYGVVSDRDVLRAVSPFIGSKTMERSQDINSLKKRVHQIMSRDLVTTTPEETIAEASEKMIQQRVSCLPVVDKDGLVKGIVTVRDIVKWSARVSEKDGSPLNQSEPDGGILIIIDGKRCYSADVSLARLIREAEALYDVNDRPDAVQTKRLATPSTATV